MKWINVKEKLPKHKQLVIAYARKKSGNPGYGVAVFVDSKKMNEDLMKTPYKHECVDIKKNPYYFVSQEQKGHTYNLVSHWMKLPESPKE